MRRSRSNRLFLLFVVLFIFYISWYIINGSRQPRRDPIEEKAYLHAVSESLPMIQNTDLCSSSEINLLFLIISFGSHFLERQSVRETWGSMSNAFDVRSQRLFVVGYQYGSNLYKDLSNEAQQEKDLLYLTVDDSLMTMKELHAYHWLEKYCSNVTYIFKTEDDLFVNSILLHELVHELQTTPDKPEDRFLYNSSLSPLFLSQRTDKANRFLFGWAYAPGKPERKSTNTFYYVSYKEYSKDLYPRYCSGFGYLLNSQTRKLLTAESLNGNNPFRFSDIYLTGILPERLNFTCNILPFTYIQGTIEQCLNSIKRHDPSNPRASKPPLIVCSTGRHVAQNTFSDYYRIWSVLKYMYGTRLSTKNLSKLEKN